MKLRLKKKYLKNIATFVGSLTICILLLSIAELGVMKLYPELTEPTEDMTRYDFDPVLGWVNKPNVAELSLASGEREILGLTSALGFRMNPASHEKFSDLNIPPMLFLGDSVTWGTCTFPDGTFVGTLNSEIDSWKSINAGVPGYTTVQEYLLLERLGPPLKPPSIILMVSTNDFASNTVAWHDKYPQPYASLTEEGVEITLIPKEIVRKRHLILFLKNSALFRLFSGRKDDSTEKQQITPAQLEKQMEIMENMLLLFRDLTKEMGSHFVVFLLPLEPHISTELPVPDPDFQYADILETANLLVKFSKDFDSESLEQQEALAQAYSQLTPPITDPRYERLLSFGEDNSIHIVDLTLPAYEIYSTLPEFGQDNFYCDYVHFNYTGHSTIAQIIMQLIPKVLSEDVGEI